MEISKCSKCKKIFREYGSFEGHNCVKPVKAPDFQHVIIGDLVGGYCIKTGSFTEGVISKVLIDQVVLEDGQVLSRNWLKVNKE